MKPHYTSIPDWARSPGTQPADRSGRAHTVLAIGVGRPQRVADTWVADLADTGATIRRHNCVDVAAALTALTDELAGARIGHRLAVSGTVGECLAVRAAAIDAGLADDEMRFGVTALGERAVWCAHCRAVTHTAADIDTTISCDSCGRQLVVYPHISRRTGHHLGFMVDAEDQPFEQSGRTA